MVPLACPCVRVEGRKFRPICEGELGEPREEEVTLHLEQMGHDLLDRPVGGPRTLLHPRRRQPLGGPAHVLRSLCDGPDDLGHGQRPLGLGPLGLEAEPLAQIMDLTPVLDVVLGHDIRVRGHAHGAARDHAFTAPRLRVQGLEKAHQLATRRCESVEEGRELAAGREHVFHRGERRSRLREHALEPGQEHALIGGEEVPDDVADGPFVRLRGGPHLVGGGVVAERAQEPRRDRETGDDERLVHGRPPLRPSGRS